jgi:hypothetical protein
MDQLCGDREVFFYRQFDDPVDCGAAISIEHCELQ